jgi:hypothetical protein
MSTRKTAANRANARCSTGPRTAEGKARASRNAVRHGLSVSVLADPELSAEVAELARLIEKGEASPLAVAVAEAQIAVRRVRRIRREVVRRMVATEPRLRPRNVQKSIRLANKVLNGPRSGPTRVLIDEAWVEHRALDDAPDGEHYSTALGEIADELRRLDRYERDALARRKFAIRALDGARRDIATPTTHVRPACAIFPKRSQRRGENEDSR